MDAIREQWLWLISTPLYFIIIGIELSLTHLQHRKAYTVKDTIANVYLMLLNSAIDLAFRLVYLEILVGFTIDQRDPDAPLEPRAVFEVHAALDDPGRVPARERNHTSTGSSSQAATTGGSTRSRACRGAVRARRPRRWVGAPGRRGSGGWPAGCRPKQGGSYRPRRGSRSRLRTPGPDVGAPRCPRVTRASVGPGDEPARQRVVDGRVVREDPDRGFVPGGTHERSTTSS